MNASKLKLPFIFAIWLCSGIALAVDLGEPVPEFSAKTIDGQATVSNADFDGEVVLLDFWASWCGPCLQSLPTFTALQQDYGDYGFRVVAINVDENIQDAKNFLHKLSVNYTVLADSTGNTPTSFNLKTMPSSFLIDRDGTVRYIHQGYRAGDDDHIRGEIEKLIQVQHAQR